MLIMDCSGHLQHTSGRLCHHLAPDNHKAILHRQHMQLTRRCCVRGAHQEPVWQQSVRPFCVVQFSLPSISLLPHAQQHFAGSITGIASNSLSAIRRSSGMKMMQLHTGARHLNPFTQIVWKRGRRRWMGLRAGRWVPIEQPAVWVLDLRQWVQWVQQQWCQSLWQIQQSLMQIPHQVYHAVQQLQYIPLPPVLLAAAVLLALLLLVAVVKQRQGVKQPAQSPVDATVLAQKAASLDQQRSRFKRALGSDEEPAAEMASSGSTAASPDIVTDQNAGKGQDNFEAWDADTQKQWKQFLKGSRSQEIEEELWWDIDREELPADRHIYQDFNR